MKMRPMTSAYLTNMSGEVNQPKNLAVIGQDTSLESPEIFGSVEPDPANDFEKAEIFNKRGVIKLGIPILNTFLAGENGYVLKKILGGGVDVEGIASGQIIFDKANNRVIKNVQKSELESINYSDDILIGGNYLKYLIDNLDIEKNIYSHLEGIMIKAYDLRTTKNGTSTEKLYQRGNFTEHSGSIHIIDRYYWEPVGYIEAGYTLEDIQQWTYGAVMEAVDKYSSRLTYLLKLREDRSPIRDQIQDFVVVMPRGYRKPFQGTADRLTKAYEGLLRASNDLWSVMRAYNVTVAEVRNAYVEMYNAYINVTYKNQDPVYNKQYKAIAEGLKGKTGHIRDKMQGARIDFSGRSVIVVDPDMSIDTIGVPVGMVTKVMEHEVLKKYKTTSSNKSELLMERTKKKYLIEKLAKEAIEGEYSVTGRQPTLYRLGSRGFKTTVVPGNAIVLNPLSCPAFNADFDGDQMWWTVPIGEEAKREVRTLMAATNNLFYPKDGKCHIAPRQEIIYGLWLATSAKFNENSKEYTYPDDAQAYDEILEKVKSQEFNIYDKIHFGGSIYTAGYIAVKACLKAEYREYRLGVLPLTKKKSIAEVPVTDKWYAELNKLIALTSKTDFTTIVNRTVQLGFAIAQIFPANVGVLDFPDTSKLIEAFEAKIEEREELYNLGHETERAFSAFYSKECADLDKLVSNTVMDNLGDKNGYVLMAKAGARGNASNLKQLFGMKGRVSKNSTEAFNAIIKHSAAQQLSTLEHAVTAYGARQGLIDKSIATYGPGYLSRLMSHTASSIFITCDDCGTDDGVLITYDFIKQFIKPEKLTGNDIADDKYVRDFVVKVLVGRHIVGHSAEIATATQAASIYEAMIATTDDPSGFKKKEGIKLRSPLTCKNPCCAKCYGRDLGTQAPAVPGFACGFEAATSIGEPATQLIMKNFQSGGVAGVKNLTSSFDIMQRYVELPKARQTDIPVDYDFISPVEGYVSTISRGDGTKELEIKGPNKNGKIVKKLRSKVLLYDDVKVKDYVKVGDSIQVKQGNLDVNEMAAYRTAEEAQSYLAMMLFNIYQSEAFVDAKHFEVLVSAMTFKLCLKGNDYFEPGLYYTLKEYHAHDTSGCIFKTTIKGVHDVPLYRNDILSTIFLEDIQKGISRSIILSGKDELKLPIVRYTLGLRSGVGSDFEDYVESRGTL